MPHLFNQPLKPLDFGSWAGAGKVWRERGSAVEGVLSEAGGLAARVGFEGLKGPSGPLAHPAW